MKKIVATGRLSNLLKFSAIIKRNSTPEYSCHFLKLFLLFNTDAYSTEDIIYKWKYQEVEVEAKSMAQFDYCSASLSSSFDMYKTG